MEKVFIQGNLEDKYHTKNPISQLLMKNFIKTFLKQLDLLERSQIHTICEIGCGEGELLKLVHNVFPDAQLYACDISPEVIDKAKRNCSDFAVTFSTQNAQKLSSYVDNQFDLVVCCEVLEHLQIPEQGLQELSRISSNNLLLSVPIEPLWSALNMLRGKYLHSFGNTPGHMNHWTPLSFNKFIWKYFSSSSLIHLYPLPWQMKLIRKINISKYPFNFDDLITN